MDYKLLCRTNFHCLNDKLFPHCRMTDYFDLEAWCPFPPTPLQEHPWSVPATPEKSNNIVRSETVYEQCLVFENKTQEGLCIQSVLSTFNGKHVSLQLTFVSTNVGSLLAEIACTKTILRKKKKKSKLGFHQTRRKISVKGHGLGSGEGEDTAEQPTS